MHILFWTAMVGKDHDAAAVTECAAANFGGSVRKGLLPGACIVDDIGRSRGAEPEGAGNKKSSHGKLHGMGLKHHRMTP